MNFARDVVDAVTDRSRPALVALARDGSRRELTFGEVSDRSARMAGALAAAGAGPGDAVMTVIPSTSEWVLSMLACWRIGAVALPCTEQLRVADLRARMDSVEPRVVVADERNADAVRAAGYSGPLLCVPDERLYERPPAAVVELSPESPALVVFTSGTSGTPKPIRHGQRYLAGQRVQAEHWFGARPGELAWCTAAPGWSKSARNVFVAPWLCGAAALLQDARFEPSERLETIEREGVNVLCMAPTEYRAIATRATLRPLPGLRHAVAAGEALDPEVVHRWRDGVGVAIHDGYGQTEAGALTGMPLAAPLRPGSMGRPLPGYRVWVDSDGDGSGPLDAGECGGGGDAASRERRSRPRPTPSRREGELCVDPRTVPTFFLDVPPGTWRTGDRARQDADGYLWFEGRTDDLIVSAGYRIGPFEVESALLSHPAVAEAAVVAAPDAERGQVVRAVVVLREGHGATPVLARALQDHVKAVTAPYKYPRVVEFAAALPKTESGKIRRAELRAPRA